MAGIHELITRIHLLEYHQTLLLKLITNPSLEFYRMVVEKGLSEQEVQNYLELCDHLNKRMKKQKAEGLMNFHPLFSEFLNSIPTKLDVQKLIDSCLKQHLYEPLFTELKKCLKSLS